MKSRRATIILNAAGLLVIVGCLAWSSHTLQEIINGFAEDRRAMVAQLAKLVRENWDGITTIPDEKKTILMNNLDPSLAAADIESLGGLFHLMLYVLMGGYVLYFIERIVRAVRQRDERR